MTQEVKDILPEEYQKKLLEKNPYINGTAKADTIDGFYTLGFIGGRFHTLSLLIDYGSKHKEELHKDLIRKIIGSIEPQFLEENHKE